MAIRGREPLYELQGEAPEIPQAVHDAVVFPFSNDDSIDSFKQARLRLGMPEYQDAQNRVAVLIGENALAASNLAYLPEDTIVMLGNEPNEVRYMEKYCFNLQMANDLDGWMRAMIPSFGLYRQWHMAKLLKQAVWWNHRNEPSALRNYELFEHRQEVARQKAFIAWYGDITSEADMERFGTALRKFDATVTLMNLTNVIPYSHQVIGARAFPTAAGYADVLQHLPITPSAPILTASRYPVHPDFDIVHATGPFYGLDDLRTGGDSVSGPIAIRYNSPEGRRRRGLAEAPPEEE